MTPEHVFVADDAVLEFFTERSRREREELFKIFTVIPQEIEEKCWFDDLNLPQGRHEKQKNQTNTIPV